MSLAYLSGVAGTASIWLSLVVLVGCGFEAMPLEEEMETAPNPPGSPPAPDTAVERHCATQDSSLQLCIDFEDLATLGGDGSGKGHHPVLDDALITTTRNSELAVEMSTLSRLQIGEHVDLDIRTNLTISMWMNTSRRPTSGAFWMLDNNKQYAMSLQSDGDIRCGLGSETVDSALPLLSGGWHHVACTFDRSQKRLKVYVDGWVAGCRTVDREIATDGREGVAIGANIAAGPVFDEHYVGQLDNIQIFSRTLSSAELCAANGGSACNTSCPGSGGSSWD